MDITRAALRRMARRGGVRRISSFVYDDARTMMIEFLMKTIHGAAVMA